MTHPGSRSGYNRAMSGGSIWHRTLVYFGLAEDESLYDDHSPVQEEVERAPRMPSVRRIDRRRGRASADEYDDLFSAEETSPGRPRRDDDTGVGLGGSSGLGASGGFGAGAGPPVDGHERVGRASLETDRRPNFGCAFRYPCGGGHRRLSFRPDRPPPGPRGAMELLEPEKFRHTPFPPTW